LFLATNAHCRPWHSQKSFDVDFVAASETFSVLPAVDGFDAFLDISQSRVVVFVQIVEKVSVVTYRSQIAFVFRIFRLDFIDGKTRTVYRPGQFRTLARQSLPSVFDIFCTHSSLLRLFTLKFSDPHIRSETMADNIS
jgi:hypothetical protein